MGYRTPKTSSKKRLLVVPAADFCTTHSEWLQRLEAPLEVRGPAAAVECTEVTEVKPPGRCIRRTELAPALLMPQVELSGTGSWTHLGKPVVRV